MDAGYYFIIGAGAGKKAPDQKSSTDPGLWLTIRKMEGADRKSSRPKKQKNVR